MNTPLQPTARQNAAVVLASLKLALPPAVVNFAIEHDEAVAELRKRMAAAGKAVKAALQEHFSTVNEGVDDKLLELATRAALQPIQNIAMHSDRLTTPQTRLNEEKIAFLADPAARKTLAAALPAIEELARKMMGDAYAPFVFVDDSETSKDNERLRAGAAYDRLVELLQPAVVAARPTFQKGDRIVRYMP